MPLPVLAGTHLDDLADYVRKQREDFRLHSPVTRLRHAAGILMATSTIPLDACQVLATEPFVTPAIPAMAPPGAAGHGHPALPRGPGSRRCGSALGEGCG